MDKELLLLKNFFESRTDILLAFLFGSRSKGTYKESSDWDVAVYFKPEEYAEIESEQEYEEEIEICSKIIDILGTDTVDLVVLNRVAPTLFYRILSEGIPITIKDKALYLDLLCKLSYEASDWIDFAEDYYRIFQLSRSIPPTERVRLIRCLSFLEREYNEI